MTFTLLGRRVELVSPVQIHAASCGACVGRGWFYQVNTMQRFTPPEGCTGVALCGCGAAERTARTARHSVRRLHRRTQFYSRMGLGRRLLLAVTGGRAGVGQPPF